MDPVPSRVIYVGSIPYDQTEEQILDIFRSVGPVANFRLVFDKETGKSKGFGFVEYHDAETASSAVRNLNNYQIGTRNLKVDFSHETSITAPSLLPSSYTDVNLPALPAGIPPPQGMSAHDAINKTLMTLTRDQMLDIILDLKKMSQKNPSLARELFNASPQLSYMIVQSLHMLEIIDNNALLSLVNQNFQQQQSQQQPPPQQPSFYQNQQPQQPPQQPNFYQNQQQPKFQRQFGGTPPPGQIKPHTPPQKSRQKQQPSNAPEQVAFQPEPQVDAGQQQQLELVRQVMQLTDEQIAQLSEDQRDALLVLRQQVQSGKFQI